MKVCIICKARGGGVLIPEITDTKPPKWVDGVRPFSKKGMPCKF